MADIMTTRILAATHPALAGHFPGHPIFPGAILLEEVIAAAESGGRTVTTIRRAKFHREYRGGGPLRIEIEERGERLTFKATVDGELLLSGELSATPGQR